MENFIKRFKQQIDTSYSPFHVVENMRKGADRFILIENDSDIELKPGYLYGRKSNDSSYIIFKMPEDLSNVAFSIAAAHTDSPTFKVKPKDPLIKVGEYYKLNVEPYGGAIYPSFLDRPLSIAGRVFVQEKNQIKPYLFNDDSNVCTIPNLAIHFNRNINSGHEYNPAIDMLPFFGMEDEISKFQTFNGYLARILNKNYKLSLKEEDIISYDLFLYNRDKLQTVGLEDSYIQAPKLDNLASVYTLLDALYRSDPKTRIPLLVVFDNEEVGSRTRQGADSTFLKDTIELILNLIRPVRMMRLRDWIRYNSFYNSIIKRSFMLSVDNAHAVHPNHPEISDPTSKVYLNKGVAIKYNASQSYTSDGLSSSLIKYIAKKNNLPLQEFTNRSDLRGGSTLGNISTSQVSLLSCDIGIPQLAMHSANELIGAKDLLNLRDLAKAYFSLDFKINGTTLEF